MLIAALVCFGLAVLFGLIIFMHVLQDAKPPRFFVYTHGPLALAGIILLIIYGLSYSSSHLIIITTLFILAGIGGLTLFYKDLTGKPISKWMAFGHGLIAFGTFIFLVIYTVSSATLS